MSVTAVHVIIRHGRIEQVAGKEPDQWPLSYVGEMTIKDAVDNVVHELMPWPSGTVSKCLYDNTLVRTKQTMDIIHADSDLDDTQLIGTDGADLYTRLANHVNSQAILSVPHRFIWCMRFGPDLTTGLFSAYKNLICPHLATDPNPPCQVDSEDAYRNYWVIVKTFSGNTITKKAHSHYIDQY